MTTAVAPTQETRPVLPRESLRVVRTAATWVAVIVGAFLSTAPGVGLAICCAALLAGLTVGIRNRSDLVKSKLIPLAAALALVPWLMVRHNEWLAISIVSTVVLVAALTIAAEHTRQSLFNFRLLSTAADTPKLPQYLRDGSSIGAALRGVIIAAPIIFILWGLLSAADDVFASIASLDKLPFERFLLAMIAAPILLKLYDHAAVTGELSDHGSPWRLGAIETTVVLGLTNLLFAAFVFVRVVASTNLPETEEEFRATVRSGFFQLLGVAGLTVVLVLWLRQMSLHGTDSERRRFRWLSASVVALAAVIDVFALQTIAVYAEGSFLSPLRYWSFGFGIWLLVVLAAVGLRVLGMGHTRNWMTAAIVGTWITFLMAMAISNPDVRIAEYAFANPQTSERDEIVVAVNPLMWLSEDATPTIVENIEFLRPMSNDRYTRVVQHLCSLEDAGWRDLNFSRADAEQQLKSLCAS